MLLVLLTILKIIGIILLVILGVALLLVSLVLFVPIRYKVKASYYDSKPVILANVSWLLHLLRVKASYQDNLEVKVKLLFFTLFSNRANVVDKNKYESYEDELSKDSDNVFDDSFDTKDEVKDKVVSDSDLENTKNSESAEQLKETDNIAFDSDETDDITKKKKTFIVNIKEKVKAIIEAVRNFIEGIKNKTLVVEEKIKSLKETVSDTENKALVKFLWGQLKILLRKIKPSKFRIKVRAGFDDPETTGKFAACAGIAYGFFGENMEIYPDFENEVIEAEVFMKGKLRLISIVITGIRVYTNRLFKKKILNKYF